MTRFRVLLRDSDSIEVDAESWANSLALALKFGWDPTAPSTAYLADGYSPSNEEALALADAWMAAMDKALKNPLEFYPSRMDMGVLSTLAEFAGCGSFTIGSKR
jgi:hypothetical protein